MLNIEEINKEIEKLENCNYTTYDVCNKLATLYIVRQHYNGNHSNNTTQNVTKMSPMMPIKE